MSVAIDNNELFALFGGLPLLVNADFLEEASTNLISQGLGTSFKQDNLVFDFIKCFRRLLRHLELLFQLFLLLKFNFVSLENNVECLEQLGPSHALDDSSHVSDFLNR